MLAGNRFKHHAEHLSIEVARYNIGQQGIFRRLINILDRNFILSQGFRFERKQPLDNNVLGHGRLKLGVDHIDGVNLTLNVTINYGPDNGFGLTETGTSRIEFLGFKLPVATPIVITCLTANYAHDDFFATLSLLVKKIVGCFGHVSIITTTQTSIRGDHQQLNLFLLPTLKQGMFTGLHANRKTGQHITHFGRIGSRLNHTILGLFQFRCRHHLHGFGDLLRTLDAAYAFSNIF